MGPSNFNFTFLKTLFLYALQHGMIYKHEYAYGIPLYCFPGDTAAKSTHLGWLLKRFVLKSLIYVLC